MLKNPERFIQEKLSKKVLSINTIRDGIMAAFLITLQEGESQGTDRSQIEDLEQWRRRKSTEIRKKASEAFATINASFEYPSLEQLKKATEGMKMAYHWDQFSKQQKENFETICESLFAKY